MDTHAHYKQLGDGDVCVLMMWLVMMCVRLCFDYVIMMNDECVCVSVEDVISGEKCVLMWFVMSVYVCVHDVISGDECVRACVCVQWWWVYLLMCSMMSVCIVCVISDNVCVDVIRGE